MKGSFYDQTVQRVRNEISDLVRGKQDSRSQPAPPAYATPQYCHQPSTNSPLVNSYSHTANSTESYSQARAYPKLPSGNQESEPQKVLEKTESIAANLLANVVGQDTIAAATHKINSVISGGPCARDYLQNFATVQLISRNSGRLLQIVLSPSGTLTFNGNGDYNGFNTYFIVERSEQGYLRFHNNYNYLAFEGKQACVMSFPPGIKNNPSIDFRIHDILGANDLIAFESCAFKNHFISILPNGNIKTSHTKDKTAVAQFSVIPIVSKPQPMYPNQTQPNQQCNMNAYGELMPNDANQSMAPQPIPSAPPPPSYAESVYNQSTASSGLYPKFN